MDVTQGTSDGGPLLAITGDWLLSHDAVTGRFARRFTCSLPTGGLAEGFRWQSETGLTLSFPDFDYDAHAAGVPESATIANSGSDSVKVSFPVPRTLLRVKISGAQADDVIEAHRVDGDVVTDDAFVQAAHGTIGATLSATDRQLVLRQTRGGTTVTLRSSNVEQLMVRSAAASVRVGVALPALSDELFYLGPNAGAVLTNPVTATQLGPALAPLLQGVSDRLSDSLAGALLPASVAMTLIIESDTPTRAHISGFILRYHLYRRRFTDQAPKRLFEFAGEALTTRQLPIDVPRGAALWSATLRMMGPFKEQSDDGAEGDGGEGGATPPAPVVPTSDLGIALHVGETAATRVTLAQAALVQGASIELVALSEATAGRVRLLRDADDNPDKPLAEQSFAPLPAGIRRIVRVDFDNPAVIGAGAVWVAIQCDDGALLWLTNTPSDGTIGNRVLRRAVGDTIWTTVSAASDRGAAASLTTASGPDAAGATAGPPSFHGVRLYLGSVRLRGAPTVPGSAGDKETRFNITEAIEPIIQFGTGPSAEVALSLTSSERGRVTVYPPEFEFDP